MRRPVATTASIALLLLVLAGRSAGQDDVGVPSLKIDPAARQAGMAGTAAGVGDDASSVFWNPGALGHLRSWQWSAQYNKWFAGLYQASFTATRQFRMLGSRRTSLGAAFNVIGAPSWDATGGTAPSVSANDFVAGVLFGQRLDWIHKSISVGGHVKYIQSRLDGWSASGMSADAGLLIRPGRFRLGRLGLGVFDFGILSFGASLTHAGGGLTYDVEETLLPMTWRAGASLRVGRYGEWSWLLASDAVGVRGRETAAVAGTEVWWNDMIGGRFGFRSNGRDLGDLSFGLGFRWDDAFSRLLGLPSRFGDAVEADLADMGFGDALHQTYRGGISHFPSAPEAFTLYDPRETRADTAGVSAVVHLDWEATEDPDPFDEIEYIVIVDRTRPKVEEAVRRLENDFEGFWERSSRYASFRDSLMFCRSVSDTACLLPVAQGGSYYWAVAAVDRDKHVRMARRGSRKVLHFLVAVPDLTVESIAFHPSPYITTTPEQGRLAVAFGNRGSAASDSFRVQIEDIFETAAGPRRTVLYSGKRPSVPVDGSGSMELQWRTNAPGRHVIRVTADADSLVLESQEKNNGREETFVTIPKGRIAVPDTVEVMMTGYSSIEVPLVPEVYFDANSSETPETYSSDGGVFPSLLPTLARRLNENPDVTLRVFGSIDALSGETDPALADGRAEDVKAGLVRLGAPGGRIEVVTDHRDRILGRRPMPKDAQDAEWIMQQNRVVGFGVEVKDEEKIFQPYQFAVDSTMRDSVKFDAAVFSPAGIRTWELAGQTGGLELDSRRAADGDSLWGDLVWKGTDRNKVVVARNRWFKFSLLLTDDAGRTFRTLSDSVYLQEKRTIQRQEIFGAAKFAKVEPVYAFYWDRVMSVAGEMVADPSMRLRFEGHACAVGPDRVNERLSLRRAEDFTAKFLERLKTRYPQQYEELRSRIAQPIGMGEREPLVIQLRDVGEVLLGDNRTPTGRYMNRRIAVLLYREN
jgi:outer membrane protein OmpA-like peptidoglycan-associated protein